MKRTPLVFVYHTMEIGGVEKEILSLLRSYNPHAFDLHLILNDVKGPFLKDIPAYVHVWQCRGDSHLPNLFYIFSLFQLFKKIQPRIVFGFMQDINFNILLFPFLGVLHYQTIITEHIHLTQWQKVKKTSWFKRLGVFLLYRTCSVCLCYGESIRQNLINNFFINTNKIIVVNNYVYLEQKTTKRIETLLKERPYFLFLGRLQEEKNIHVLLIAFSLFCKQDKDQMLILVGPGNIELYRAIATHLGIEKRVIFWGPTLYPFPFYIYATAIILPSLVEGRSRVMVEAMMASCLVICGRWVGSELYIRDKYNGLLFQLDSPNELCEKMRYAVGGGREIINIKKNAKKSIFDIYSKSFYKNYRSSLNKIISLCLQSHT